MTETVSVDQHWWVVRAIADMQSNVMAVTAGLGSGKTHGECQWLFDRIALNEGARYFGHMMPVYELIHNTAIPTWQEVLQSYDYDEGKDYEIAKSPFPKLIFKGSKQEVHFLSGNRPDKIKAVQYGDAVMDEPGVTSVESFRRLRERIRNVKSKTNQLLLGGTPEGINWFADEFDSDTLENWHAVGPRDDITERYVKETGETTRYRRFRLTSFDNAKYLPKGYIADIFDVHRHNPNYIQAYVYGLFVALVTGNCYKNYKPQIHDCDDMEPSPHKELDLSWDFNANPLAWVSFQSYAREEYGERRNVDIAIHEANLGGTTIEESCLEFAAKHPLERFANTQILLYGDSSGHAQTLRHSSGQQRSDYDAVRYYLTQLGYKRVEVRALKYNPIESQSVDALDRAFAENKHYVCKRCAKYRRSLAATRFKDNSRKIDKPQNDDWTHWSDAAKYRFYARYHGPSRKVSAQNY